MYNQESYNRHGDWYNQHFPTRDAKINYLNKNKSEQQTVSNWLQQQFFDCINPLLNTKMEWLTVGDAYGFDARYIEQKGSKVMATDLNADFLEVAKEEGVISSYAAENAEQLSFANNQFDYVLCKESYHHFPRPYAALYEMIRVAKKGILIIEPQDPVSKMPVLLMLTNLFASRSKLLNMTWKNRFSYEPVGNFVYKVSEREFEKFAAGLNLPLVAFKRINPNFYFKGAENVIAGEESKKFRAIRSKKRLMDLLVKLKVIPGQVLSAVIFKEAPEADIIKRLKEDGYHLIAIPVNPYL